MSVERAGVTGATTHHRDTITSTIHSPFLAHPSSFLAHLSTYLAHPSSYLAHPSSSLAHLSSHLAHPSSVLAHPSFPTPPSHPHPYLARFHRAAAPAPRPTAPLA